MTGRKCPNCGGYTERLDYDDGMDERVYECRHEDSIDLQRRDTAAELIDVLRRMQKLIGVSNEIKLEIPSGKREAVLTTSNVLLSACMDKVEAYVDGSVLDVYGNIGDLEVHITGFDFELPTVQKISRCKLVEKKGAA